MAVYPIAINKESPSCKVTVKSGSQYPVTFNKNFGSIVLRVENILSSVRIRAEDNYIRFYSRPASITTGIFLSGETHTVLDIDAVAHTEKFLCAEDNVLISNTDDSVGLYSGAFLSTDANSLLLNVGTADIECNTLMRVSDISDFTTTEIEDKTLSEITYIDY